MKTIHCKLKTILSQLFRRFSYIEFMDKDAVENALKLDESMFKGRQLKVR